MKIFIFTDYFFFKVSTCFIANKYIYIYFFFKLNLGSHLGFPIGTILAFLIYKSPRCFLASLESTGLLVQEKKRKIDFQDGRHGGHLGFPIGTILAIFDLKVTRCFLASLESIGLSVQEKKRKVDFQDGRHGGHLGFQIGTILAIFDLQVTPMLPTKYPVNWPRSVGGVGF